MLEPGWSFSAARQLQIGGMYRHGRCRFFDFERPLFTQERPIRDSINRIPDFQWNHITNTRRCRGWPCAKHDTIRAVKKVHYFRVLRPTPKSTLSGPFLTHMDLIPNSVNNLYYTWVWFTIPYPCGGAAAGTTTREYTSDIDAG